MKRVYCYESELINIKEQDGGFSFGKVYIHKYSKKSFYKGLWDGENVNARGHIYDEDGILIVNPFKKTFNWGVVTNEMVTYNLQELVEDLGSIPINI